MMSDAEESPLYTKKQYEELAFKSERQQEIIDKLREENAGLSEALLKQSVEKAKLDEGEAKLSNPELIKKAAFYIMRNVQSPKVLLIKYKGQTVYDVTKQEQERGNP